MGIKSETPLQERIQKLIIQRGGYVLKAHGDMITEPGIPDLIVGYKGMFIGIEVKVDNNTPSRAQGIHCRNIWKTGNIAFITWDLETVRKILSYIDYCLDQNYNVSKITTEVYFFMEKYNIDNGRSW